MRSLILVLLRRSFNGERGFCRCAAWLGDDPRNGCKQNSTFLALARPPAEITAILERSCSDCHSEQTRWPWYSHLPVIGKQMEQHVIAGRLMLDLSDWKGHIEAWKPKTNWTACAFRRSRGRCRFRNIWLLHPQSRLTDQEIETLCKWTASKVRPES